MTVHSAKTWNGAAWVVRKIKTWNGTAWVQRNLQTAPFTTNAATDLPGWKLIVNEDFNTNCAEGSFLTSYPNVAAYPANYQTTYGKNAGTGDHYDTNNISVSGGVMNMRLYRDGFGKAVGCCPYPKLPGGGLTQKYGRYEIRFKADTTPGWKTAWLLWPGSEVWPRDGEIDFPEGSLSGSIGAFMHRQDGTSGSDQDAYSTSVLYNTWHTAVIEWKPNSCKFILDGNVVGTSTNRVPNTPMRWAIQSENNLSGTQPSTHGTANIQVDYWRVWSYNP